MQTNFVTSGSLRERIPDHEGPSWVERQQGTVDGARLYEQERLVLAATEDLCELMVRQDVSKAELARRLGTSRANITQLLNGSRNLTLRTLADLAWACDARVNVRVESLRREGRDRPWRRFVVLPTGSRDAVPPVRSRAEGSTGNLILVA